MNPMLFNLIHRPGINAMQWEAFKWQQDRTHDRGLKVTVLVTFHTLFDPDKVETLRNYQEVFGDELGIYLGDYNCPRFFDKMASNEPSYWLFSREDKQKVVELLYEKFHEAFSFYPTATGAYCLDSSSVDVIKANYPATEVAIAGCFEEGVHVYHGCNNTWYLFGEGGPWWPWIPSKQNIHCPAANESEDSGIVGLPHLTRDMLLSIESRDDYFSSHPVGNLRGMIYTDDNVTSYFQDFMAETRAQGRYNNGYAYCNIFAGPAWLVEDVCCWEVQTETCRTAYEKALDSLAQWKRQGQLTDMHMSEFARWYRRNRKEATPVVSLWHDILCGSEREAFWYIDSDYRVLIDPNQGGAIVDLRPYVGRLERSVGADTELLDDGSYPFVVHAEHRGGFRTHFGKGSICSCRVRYQDQVVDLCERRTKGTYEDNAGQRRFVLDPVEVEFDGLKATIASEFSFNHKAVIQVQRRFVASSVPDATIDIEEYLNGCWGTNQYQKDLRGVTLVAAGARQREELAYNYKCRKRQISDPESVAAIVPALKAELALIPQLSADRGEIEEGFVFQPFFTLSVTGSLREGEQTITWLQLRNV